MPSRDENGKRLGFAAQRRKKQQRDREEVARQIERGERPAPMREALQYSAIPVPDLRATASMVRYAAQVLAVVMDQTMLDPAISEEQRRRELRDTAAKLGMVRDKAGEQEKIDQAREAAERGEKHAGLEPIPPASGTRQ